LGFLTNTTLGTFDLRLFTTCNCFCLESLWGEQICQVIWWWVRVWRCPRLKPHGCSLLGPAWESDMSCTICAVFNCQVPVGSMTWEFLSTPPLCSPSPWFFAYGSTEIEHPIPPPCKFSLHVFKNKYYYYDLPEHKPLRKRFFSIQLSAAVFPHYLWGVF
jgi:hypothetical protein